MSLQGSRTQVAPIAWARVPTVLLGLVVVAFAVASVGTGAGYLPSAAVLGYDFTSYHDAVVRFLSGGGFYEARQLAGPWTFETYREPLYPPSSLVVFVPFAFLPAILWWVIPAAVIAWSIRHHRPSGLALAFIAVALCSRTSVYAWWVGNPGIWLAAAVALATVKGWGPLVLFKPSYFPFALIGLARRGWWLAAGFVGLAVLVTLPLWADYFTVLRNAPPLGYSILGDIPLVAVPLLAWLGRTTPPRSIPGTASAQRPAASPGS